MQRKRFSESDTASWDKWERLFLNPLLLSKSQHGYEVKKLDLELYSDITSKLRGVLKKSYWWEKRNFEQSHSAENLNRGTLWDFLKLHSVANYQKMRGFFGDIKKLSKIVSKAINTGEVSSCRKSEKKFKKSKAILLFRNGFVFHVGGFGCVQKRAKDTIQCNRPDLFLSRKVTTKKKLSQQKTIKSPLY